MIRSRPRIWVLTDDRTGDVSQCLGVAEALGLPFETRDIVYTAAARLPNALRPGLLSGIAAASRAALTPPWPDLVIGAGRRTAPVARHIKRRGGGHAFLAQLMWPGEPTKDFDLIAAPEHDQPPDRANIISTIGAPHRVTPRRLEAEGAAWRQRINHLATPRIALLVGGATGRKRFGPDDAAALGRAAARLAGDAGGSLLVTTSRRTGDAATAALMAAIDIENLFHCWAHQGENPFYAFLALSDAAIVTGDSTSMCSEACATTRPVFISAPDAITAPKHKRLHQRLYSLGYARPLDGPLDAWSHPPLNAAAEIARAIKERAGFGTGSLV